MAFLWFLLSVAIGVFSQPFPVVLTSKHWTPSYQPMFQCANYSYSMDGVAFFTTDQSHVGAHVGTQNSVFTGPTDLTIPPRNCSVSGSELNCKTYQRVNPSTGCGISLTLWVGSLQNSGSDYHVEMRIAFNFINCPRCQPQSFEVDLTSGSGSTSGYYPPPSTTGGHSTTGSYYPPSSYYTTGSSTGSYYSTGSSTGSYYSTGSSTGSYYPPPSYYTTGSSTGSYYSTGSSTGSYYPPPSYYSTGSSTGSPSYYTGSSTTGSYYPAPSYYSTGSSTGSPSYYTGSSTTGSYYPSYYYNNIHKAVSDNKIQHEQDQTKKAETN